MILSFELMRQAGYSRALHPLFFLIRYCILSLFVAFPVCVPAQDDSDLDVVRVRTDLVTVPAFVTDTRGRRVMNMAATDFELRDDGRVAKIEYFIAGTERAALIFVLDASGSTHSIIRQQRDAALALFSRFGPQSEVAVMRFAEGAKLVAPFSKASNDTMAAFNLPALENRRTAIFDAVAAAIRVFDSRRANAAERRIIILLSDGLDTVSVTSFKSVIAAVRDRGISIYSIQIPLYAPRDGSLQPRSARKGFREIAEKSGGRYFMAGDAGSALAANPSYDLSPIFQTVEEDLRGQYVLGYYPDETTRDGRFHRIELALTSKDKRKLRVHLLRDGYNSNK